MKDFRKWLRKNQLHYSVYIKLRLQELQLECERKEKKNTLIIRSIINRYELITDKLIRTSNIIKETCKNNVFQNWKDHEIPYEQWTKISRINILKLMNSLRRWLEYLCSYLAIQLIRFVIHSNTLEPSLLHKPSDLFRIRGKTSCLILEHCEVK